MNGKVLRAINRKNFGDCFAPLAMTSQFVFDVHGLATTSQFVLHEYLQNLPVRTQPFFLVLTFDFGIAGFVVLACVYNIGFTFEGSPW